MTRMLRAALAVSLVVAVAACKKAEPPAPPPPPAAAPPAAVAPPPAPAPLTVAGITVGKSLGPDGKSIGEATTIFAPSDTLYVSVATTGAAGRATLAARWIYGSDQVVKDDTQDISPTGPATHEFHLAKPDGWPVGAYKVAITLDGRDAGERSFEVK